MKSKKYPDIMKKANSIYALSITAFCVILSIFFSFFCPAYGEDKDAVNAKTVKEMSLAESIALALRKNRTIELAYLDRIVQKFDLRVAEDRFTPKPTISSTVKKTSDTTDGVNTFNNISSVSGDISTYLPTGGQLDISSSRTLDKPKDSQTSRDDKWKIALTQPLLKGGGLDVPAAPIKIAKITDDINVLYLKTTLMDTVTFVITAYRNFQQADKQVGISRQSLERAREIVAMNKGLIAAGRMAEVEIVQTEADAANREINLLSAMNSVESARFALIKLLDIDKQTRLAPTETLDVTAALPDYEQCKTFAFNNRPDYLSALLNIEMAKLNLVVARNNKLWDLSLLGSYGRNYLSPDPGTGKDIKNWNAGVQLTIPLRDLTLQQKYLTAKIALDKAEISLRKLRDNIEIEIQEALKDAEMKLRQAKLAKLTRELYEKKLGIEKEKLSAGRSTNFQIVIAQSDLFNAQSYELSAVMSYLNSHASLDRILGRTLEKWNIRISDRQGEERYDIYN